jgi:hypothetical protein
MDSDLAALAAIRDARADQLYRLPNVLGSAIGKRYRGGEQLDELCIRVLVERKVAKSELRDDEVIPNELFVPGIGSAPTDVVETGRIEPVLDLGRYRPVKGGCLFSTGGTGGNGGTLGGLAYDGRTLEPAYITNWHAMFKIGYFRPTLPVKVFQPGISTDELIGYATEDPVPLVVVQSVDPTAPGYVQPGTNWSDYPLNVVDAAKGNLHSWPYSDPDYRWEVLDVGPAIFQIGAPYDGQRVQKRGAGSFFTKGYIDGFKPDFVAQAGNFLYRIGSEIMIRTDDGSPFSVPGDSGSVLFSEGSSGLQALGLIYSADASGYAYACDIQYAFSALGLVTVCRGMYLKGVREANYRKAMWGRGPRGSLFEEVAEQMKRFDELRAFVQRSSEPGRALIETATAAIPEIADPLERDPVAFGLYVRLMEKFALAPTVLDLLELELDDKSVDLFQRFLRRLARVEPGLRETLREIGGTVTEARGKRIADLVHTDLGE